MAEIPSGISSSAAQAGFTARQVETEREARRAGQANTAERHAKKIDENDSTVDTNDADSQVFSDSEGEGSQGRTFQEGSEEAPEDQDNTAAEDITHDDDGQAHLDVQA